VGLACARATLARVLPRQPAFYEVVEILDSPVTRELGVAGERGVVAGVPPADVGIEDFSETGDPGTAQYAVDVAGDGFAIALRDLRPTGTIADASAYETGDSIRVSLDGRLLDAEDPV